MTADNIGALLDTLCYLAAIVYVAVKLVRLTRFGIKSVDDAENGRAVFLLAIAFNAYGVVSYWYDGSVVRCGLAAVIVALCSAYVYVANWQIDRRRGAVK